MNNGRDCPHGRQVGKCDTCDLIEAEKRVEGLEQKNAELAEQVEQLKDMLNEAAENDPSMDINGTKWFDKLSAVNKSTPAQCLADRDAEVAAKARLDLAESIGANIGAGATMDEVIEMILFELRQQAKGE